MKRILAAAVLAAVVLSPAGSLSGRAVGSSVRQPARLVTGPPRAVCTKTFTVPMAQRAARAVYAGHRRVYPHEHAMLGRILRCQRNARAQWFVRWYYRHQRQLHRQRVLLASMSYAVASWYSDGGATASGWHATYGIANRWLAFGTHVLICFHGRCVTTTVDDRGPYVGGRDFDLNQNVAGALGFDGVATVGYRVM